MGGRTFYSALGVDRDADADRIRRAYRERVKDSHPDVSDDPDSRQRFERLTTARNVLVDDVERRRYDRLGHETYVDAHISSDVWETRSTSGADETTLAGVSSRVEDPAERGRWPWIAPEPDGAQSRARGGAWQQASAAYQSSPTGGSPATRTPLDSLTTAVRSLGPWLAVYAVFLGSGAAVVGGFVAEYATDPSLSIPLAAGGVGVIAVIVFLTAVHVATQLAA
ncbi:MAG: J domain-containing protein [Salinirussus sp.]